MKITKKAVFTAVISLVIIYIIIKLQNTGFIRPIIFNVINDVSESLTIKIGLIGKQMICLVLEGIFFWISTICIMMIVFYIKEKNVKNLFMFSVHATDLLIVIELTLAFIIIDQQPEVMPEFTSKDLPIFAFVLVTLSLITLCLFILKDMWYRDEKSKESEIIDIE